MFEGYVFLLLPKDRLHKLNLLNIFTKLNLICPNVSAEVELRVCPSISAVMSLIIIIHKYF